MSKAEKETMQTIRDLSSERLQALDRTRAELVACQKELDEFRDRAYNAERLANEYRTTVDKQNGWIAAKAGLQPDGSAFPQLAKDEPFDGFSEARLAS